MKLPIGRKVLCLLPFLMSGLARAAPPEPQAVADRIDRFLAVRFQDEKISPAPLATDEEFLRRVYLDLTGRIPPPSEVYSFLENPRQDKRAVLIDRLLESPRYASHSAAVWRAALTPETSALPEARIFRAGFEAWLRDKFRSNVPYDRMVRELLTVPFSTDANNPTPVLLQPDAPNPNAFFAVKEVKPENLAAVTTRVFLGVQIECAQCHNHPFAKWTKEQFWNQAAFFAGLNRYGDGLFSPVSENTGIREISIGETKKRVSPRFLDEKSPPLEIKGSLRSELADWVTSKTNPYFAKTAANRVWARMFGRGIVDPVDDLHDDNPPSHPELLDFLARQLVDSDFDMRQLIRGIGRSQAYQRSSATLDPRKDSPRLFSRMAVKGLSAEQLYDSVLQATGMRFEGNRRSPRDQFLNRFAMVGKPSDPETSIPQALSLMNGKLIADATTLETSPTLKFACELPDQTDSQRVEILFISALARYPSSRENEILMKYIGSGNRDQIQEKLADIFWVILNSAEFRLNH